MPPFVYRNGLWIAPIVFAVATAALILLIFHLIRLSEKSQLFSGPLVARQIVRLERTGAASLAIQGPRFTTEFSGLSFGLAREDSGEKLRGRSIWFRFRSSDVSSVRTEIESYEIPEAGNYVLQIQGLKTGAELGDHRIVLVRSNPNEKLATILGLIFTGAILIGSVVLFALRLTNPQGWA